MDGKEPKTDEAPAQTSAEPYSAQQVTSTDKNKTKPNKDPNEEERAFKAIRRSKGIKPRIGRPRRGGIITRSLWPSPERATIIIHTHSNSFSSKFRSLTGWTVR